MQRGKNLAAAVAPHADRDSNRQPEGC